jgi:hypothetical protein
LSRKIDARELLAALGGLLVLVSLFLDWYSRDRGIPVLGGTGISGWEAFEALDLVLAGLAVAAIATGAAAFGTTYALRPRTLLPVGLVLVVIVAVQLVSPPPVAWGDDLDTGAWLALAGSVLVLLGGLLRAARIAITVDVGARDTRPRVAAVDRRPGAAAPAPSPGQGAGRAGQGAERAAEDDAPIPRRPAGEAPPRRSLLDEPDPEATQPFKPVDGEP